MQSWRKLPWGSQQSFFTGKVPNSLLLGSGHEQQKLLPFLRFWSLLTGFLGWEEGGKGTAAISWEGLKKGGAIWKAQVWELDAGMARAERNGLPGVGETCSCQGQPTIRDSVLEGFPHASVGRDRLQEGLCLAPVTKRFLEGGRR